MIALRNNQEQQNQEVFQWLENYTGTFEFLLSLKTQLLVKGYLSDKQISAAERCMQNASKPKLEVVKPEFSVKNGQVLEVKKSFAQKIAESHDSSVTFFNFEVLEVKAETHRAVLIKTRASAKVTSHCTVCGRTLTDPASIMSGIGPVCAEKHGIPYGSLEATKAHMEHLAIKQAEFETWIPKSVIKNFEELKNNC